MAYTADSSKQQRNCYLWGAADVAVRFIDLSSKISVIWLSDAVFWHFLTLPYFYFRSISSDDIELVSYVATSTAMIFTKPEVGQPTRSWLITFLLLKRFVTLWPIRAPRPPSGKLECGRQKGRKKQWYRKAFDTCRAALKRERDV